jgi:hypothetical protein
MKIDKRKKVFVGGVKRNMKEVELEMIMDTLYRGV